MNVFLKEEIANKYDQYYRTPMGIKIDQLEKDAIGKFLNYCVKGKILEMGCGTGHWTEFLDEQGFQITACDISEAMLEVARQKNFKNVDLQKADATHLPYSDESFDMVVAITMLEFTDDIEKVLSEVNRVLKPDGCIILGCLNLNSQLGKNKTQDDTFREAHFLTKAELEQQLSIIGKVEISECVYLNHTFEVLDGSMEEYPVEGVFLAAYVKKNK